MNQPIIPKPQKVQLLESSFSFSNNTVILYSSAAQGVAAYLAGLLRPSTGFPFPLRILAEDTAGSEAIILSLSNRPINSPEEYTLTVTPERIQIVAPTAHGLFYGVQSLRQMLPPAIEMDSPAEGLAWNVQAVAIEDAPRFRWRGLLLDVGRHFYPLSFIKKFIDLMALLKYNVFHWHLTEDQGWRIEIHKYPRLTEIGAYRKSTPIAAARDTADNTPYGGYYTQEEVREVVAYAAERFVTVVPEIEMPGHALAALAAYPELGCVGQGYEVGQWWGVIDDVFCAGNDALYPFLEDVLSEIFELFPSEFIHIGGDECPKTRWEACPKCQAKIKAKSLKDEHELQSYVIQRMEKFLNDNGRRLIGWDEILEGGLAPNATVMSWRGAQGGIDAATAGHDVVMSPYTHVYFDYYQSQDKDNEPPAIGGFIPLEKVYQFDPTEGIPVDKTSHVLGGQGNLWTEYLPSSDLVEYRVYPRAAALAETVWSGGERDYAGFLARLPHLLQRLDQLQVNYRPLDVT